MENTKVEIYQKCIDTSSACAVACLRYANAFDKKNNSTEIESFKKLLNTCAVLCLDNLKSLASESEFLLEMCNKCEEICVKCEVECEKYTQNDYCKMAAIACGNCAMECKIVSEM